MKRKRTATTFQLFCIFFIALTLLAYFKIPSVSSQVEGKYTIIIKIEQTVPLTSNLTLDNLGLLVNYTLSKNFSNLHNDGPLHLGIPKGILVWEIKGNYTGKAEVLDNLGNQFDAIIVDGRVVNPAIEVDLPPNFEYNIWISVITTEGLSLDTEQGSFVFHAQFNIPTDMTLIIELPSDFSILQFNPDCIISQNENLILFNWKLDKGQIFDSIIRFIPFSNEPTLRSLSWTFEMPDTLPITNFFYVTVNEVVSTKAKFDSWEISPVFAIPITFPIDTPNAKINEVYDGQGICRESHVPNNEITKDSLGFYN